MNTLLLLALLSGGGQVQDIANTFGVDWPHLVSQIISFCIVCLVLHRFAYKPVLKMLEERRRQIALGIANADKIAAELAKTEAQRHEVMMRADAEATKLIEEARAAAARLQEQETRKAMAAAEQIIAKSHEAAAQDYDRMLTELKQEVGRLVVQTTATVAGRVLTPEDQRRLAEETTRELAAAA
jgi:F-type H+-transporting ATPase subunit b